MRVVRRVGAPWGARRRRGRTGAAPRRTAMSRYRYCGHPAHLRQHGFAGPELGETTRPRAWRATLSLTHTRAGALRAGRCGARGPTAGVSRGWGGGPDGPVTCEGRHRAKNAERRPWGLAPGPPGDRFGYGRCRFAYGPGRRVRPRRRAYGPPPGGTGLWGPGRGRVRWRGADGRGGGVGRRARHPRSGWPAVRHPRSGRPARRGRPVVPVGRGRPVRRRWPARRGRARRPGPARRPTR